MTLKNSVWSRFCSVVLLAALLSSFLPAATAQQAASRIVDPVNDHQLVTIKGSVHPDARQEYDRGTVPESLPMDRIVLVLKRSDEQEKQLQTQLSAMHDPKSPQFHKWLTPKGFGSQYGASEQDVAKITAWLASQGFKVNRVANGRQTIEFSGTASAVESAFHTSIHTYKVNGELHYANATNPEIPAAFSPVVAGVLSLHNFQKHATARVLSKAQIIPGTGGQKATLKYDPNFTSSSGSHAVSPGDLWTIYNEVPLITSASSKVDGAGQTIAIVGRSDISLDDYTGFRKNLLPAPYSGTVPFTQIQNGPDPGLVNGDELEQALDVEYSSAMAPAAQIDLVVSGTTNTTDGVDLSAEYIVDNNLAPVMSTSYGSCEAEMGTGNQFYASLWEQAAAQGITSMVASGDNGSAGCDLVGPSGVDNIGYVADEGLQVSGLASTPYNVAVGGNEFSDDSTTYWSSTNASSLSPLTSALSYVPEMVWNESCSPLVCGNAAADIAGGSGGSSGCFNPTLDATGAYITACSGGYATPSWQAGVVGIPTSGMRSIPDVSLTAASHDGYMVCYNGSCDSQGVYIIGGTSASSPSFAGIMALVNQKTASRQGQANYTLYSLAGAEYGTASAPNTAILSSCSATSGSAIGSSCIFHDVITGTNAMPCDGGTLDCSSTTSGTYGVLSGYAAGTGFDRASGLGSVNVSNLVNHWSDASTTSTTTSLTLASTQSTFGQPVTIAVAVAPTTGTGTPIGDVALLTDSTLPGATSAGLVTLTSGAYSGTVSSLPGGTYNVYARYAGDATYGASTSISSPIVVSPASSSMSLAITGSDPVTGTAATTIQYGNTISAVATLAGVSGQTAPVGTVTFLNGGTTLATETSDATGVASYNSSGYGIGSYTWTASYGGNANYKPTASAAVGFTVGKANTSLKLLTNSGFVVGTATATLTAIIVDDSKLLNPTGTVTFSANGASLGSSPVTVYADPSTGASEGVAKLQISAASLLAGANSVTSTYAGDGNYSSSSSPTITIGYSATAAANTITLAATPAAATTEGVVTLTATVVTGGIPATAGTVTFFDGTTALGSVQVAGSSPAKGHTTGAAVLTLRLGPGTHAITASYGGILAAPTAITSAVSTVTVTGTTPSLVSIAAASNTGDPLNYDLTATVTGYGLAVPTASVDFAETSIVSDLGTVTVNPASANHTLLTPKLTTAGDSNAPPSFSVVADFNGDGIPDIATANASFSGGSMSVLIGNGNGTFKAPVVYPTVAIFSSAITSGDFNNDGVLDIAVTSQYSQSFGNGVVGIFLGNGDGTFQPQIAVNQPGYPVGAVTADFNRDGILDLVTLQYYPMQLSVEYGNGDGTFQAPINYPIGSYTDSSAYTIALGDFNGDGAPDVVELNANDNNAGVFMNAGDGTLSLREFVPTGTSPEWVGVSDLNKDGKQDLVVSNYSDSTLGVMLGNGDGTFQNQVVYPVNGVTASFAFADLNGDGNVDIAATYFYPTAAIGVLLGKGDGTFGAVTDHLLNQGHGYGVTIADLNGDGAPDIIATDINSGDTISQALGILMNVTQATATASDVAVAGPTSVQEQIEANYAGDVSYNASASAGLSLKGSGAKATPVILWTPAAMWGAGVPLGTSVLNGVVDGNIAGTITYTAQMGGGATVAVNAGSSLTSLGSYLMTLTFTPTDTTNYSVTTAQRTVQIVSPDFTVATDVQALTIISGSAGTVNISIPALYGFSGGVALSCTTPLPSGFSCSGTPSSIAPGATSVFTIQTTGLTAKALNVKPMIGLRKWETGVSVAFAMILLLPVGRSRRRKLTALTMVALLAVMAGVQGCGGSAGFSQDTVALTSSASKASSGTSVSLTATVTSKHSKPGGTVTFYNGTTALGSSVALTGNTATLAVTTLPVGLDSLTAVYSGDTNDSGATSSGLAQLITGQTSVQIQGTNGTTTHSSTVIVTLQ
ncbi:MAG: hypothetical protein HIU93_12365 [Acidobacteria bacterium]|nr:hypothetical protein [Acidobacteriota bacterium]